MITPFLVYILDIKNKTCKILKPKGSSKLRTMEVQISSQDLVGPANLTNDIRRYQNIHVTMVNGRTWELFSIMMGYKMIPPILWTSIISLEAMFYWDIQHAGETKTWRNVVTWPTPDRARVWIQFFLLTAWLCLSSIFFANGCPPSPCMDCPTLSPTPTRYTLIVAQPVPVEWNET